MMDGLLTEDEVYKIIHDELSTTDFSRHFSLSYISTIITQKLLTARREKIEKYNELTDRVMWGTD